MYSILGQPTLTLGLPNMIFANLSNAQKLSDQGSQGAGAPVAPMALEQRMAGLAESNER